LSDSSVKQVQLINISPNTFVCGDGRITITDSQLIARVSSGLEGPNCASDYDRNERTDILDGLFVAQIAVGSRL